MISGPRLSRHHQRWGGGSNSSASFSPHGVAYYTISTNLVRPIEPSVATPIAHPAGRHAICVQIRRDWSAGTKRRETSGSRPHRDWKPKSAASSKHSFSALASEASCTWSPCIFNYANLSGRMNVNAMLRTERNSTWMMNKVCVHSNLLLLHVWHK